MVLDLDLQSIQEVRNLVSAAKAAQKVFAAYPQAEIDRVVRTVYEALLPHCERLAKMAVEETGFGNWPDKTIKNLLGSTITYEYIKDMKTVGELSFDRANGIMEVGVPMGVVAAIVPSTNPTSTTMYKTLISLKSGNAVVFSPHPAAKNCILETVSIILQALKKAGAPDGLVGCISKPTVDASGALMKHRDVAIILATGGEGMVRAAYSSGNPALGVGPGNGPSYIHRSANIKMAVKHIFDSKTFDNGTICASEQSIVTESCIRAEVEREVRAAGGYFMSAEEGKKVGSILLRANGTMNPAIVGKTAETIAKMAGITVPQGTRVLLCEQTEVSKKNPYSREKLCPVLGYYVEENWERACERCIAILENEGVGHTMTLHAEDAAVIREFALKKPVNRLLINTPGALGGVGATTNLAPALTLGCGAIGKSATSDNVSPMHLINIRRIAWGTKELDTIRQDAGQSACAASVSFDTASVSRDQIEAITRAVLSKLRADH